jgi:hypothetical protein
MPFDAGRPVSLGDGAVRRFAGVFTAASIACSNRSQPSGRSSISVAASGFSSPLGDFAMTEMPYSTWDAPPFPENGDLDEDSTYAGVGRVLSAWEAAESELSHLYAWFVGKLHQPEAYREYGTGRIFADRMKILKAAAEAHFVRCPHQSREADFDCRAEIAEKFASRRNEVAHSIVRDLGNIRPRRFSDAFGRQFFLVPSYYNYQRYGPDNMPTYAYTSVELSHLNNGLWLLRAHLAVYRENLGPQPVLLSKPAGP